MSNVLNLRTSQKRIELMEKLKDKFSLVVLACESNDGKAGLTLDSTRIPSVKDELGNELFSIETVDHFEFYDTEENREIMGSNADELIGFYEILEVSGNQITIDLNFRESFRNSVLYAKGSNILFTGDLNDVRDIDTFNFPLFSFSLPIKNMAGIKCISQISYVSVIEDSGKFDESFTLAHDNIERWLDIILNYFGRQFSKSIGETITSKEDIIGNSEVSEQGFTLRIDNLNLTKLQ